MGAVALGAMRSGGGGRSRAGPGRLPQLPARPAPRGRRTARQPAAPVRSRRPGQPRPSRQHHLRITRQRRAVCRHPIFIPNGLGRRRCRLAQHDHLPRALRKVGQRRRWQRPSWPGSRRSRSRRWRCHRSRDGRRSRPAPRQPLPLARRGPSSAAPTWPRAQWTQEMTSEQVLHHPRRQCRPGRSPQRARLRPLGSLASSPRRQASSAAATRLVEGRPGSWEASLVDQLVKGTVGYGDEYLPRPAPEAPRPPGSTRSAAETPATRSSRGSSQPNQTSPRPRSATSSRARRGRG